VQEAAPAMAVTSDQYSANFKLDLSAARHVHVWLVMRSEALMLRRGWRLLAHLTSAGMMKQMKVIHLLHAPHDIKYRVA
jgi:hypothetical protein